ncbi:MAG: hypothetical protein FWG59_03620 [Betaproteobacteria bacterium]|nr:hypothetical protein [Betaproteobacteria bacterium]
MPESNLSPLIDGLSSVLKVGLLGVLASACFVPWKLGFATRNMALGMFGVVFVLWLIGAILL